jgi:hypothetical protein
MATCDQFIDVRGKSDRDVALLARELRHRHCGGPEGVHEGWQARHLRVPRGCRAGELPGLSGHAGRALYGLSDRRSDAHTGEQPALLQRERSSSFPFSYQVNDSKRAIAQREFTCEELELPQSGFVFCCLNNTYKITPSVFDCWMRIVKRVEGSVLWLFEDNPSAASLSAARSAAPRRTAGAADIHASVWPKPNTWLGIARRIYSSIPGRAMRIRPPAIRCGRGSPCSLVLGEAFARQGGGEPAERCRLAGSHCRDPGRLRGDGGGAGRATLSGWPTSSKDSLPDVASAPLFDTQLSTRHLELAFRQILARHQDGLPALSIW